VLTEQRKMADFLGDNYTKFYFGDRSDCRADFLLFLERISHP
jgi:hypothetical protein